MSFKSPVEHRNVLEMREKFVKNEKQKQRKEVHTKKRNDRCRDKDSQRLHLNK